MLALDGPSSGHHAFEAEFDAGKVVKFSGVLTKVVCFPKQSLEPAAQVAFSRQFGELEVHVSGAFHALGHPEVMILSKIVKNGNPGGLADDGQGWNTEMSFGKTSMCCMR
jgi:alpha-ketoglutarate-dependent taurine dioxygenase